MRRCAGAEGRERPLRGENERAGIEHAFDGNLDGEYHRGRTAHDVLQRREGETLAAKLCLRRNRVRVGFEVRAGVHHHAELREEQRERQDVYEPAAITANQNGLRGRVSPQ